MVDDINDAAQYHHHQRNDRISVSPQKHHVKQRAVGLDTASFAKGLRRIIQETPGVIMVGEPCDSERIAIALKAADAGHLVLSRKYANNVVMAINRLSEGKEHQSRCLPGKCAEDFTMLDMHLVQLSRSGMIT